MSAPSFQNPFRDKSKRKNLVSLAVLILLFLSIPLTIFVAINVREERSRAETVPYVVLEESLKKLDLKYSPRNEKLTLSSKTKESRLPRKQSKKSSKTDKKVLAISVEQRNEYDRPIYNFVQEIEVAVNNKGEVQNGAVDFSVEIPDKKGKVIFTLGEKKLLEVTL